MFKNKMLSQLLFSRSNAVLFIFFFLSANLSRAQLVTLPHIEIISEKEGLPFNWVSNIVQDANGYIWVAGPYGLCRYDGYSFWTLPSQPTDTTTLFSNEITGLALHHDGTLWAGHREGKISVVNTTTGKVRRLQIPKTEGSYVHSIFSDSRGNVWMAANGFGIYCYQKNHFQFFGQINNFPKGADPSTFYTLREVNRFYESAHGTVWFCSNNGLYYIAKDEIKHVSYVSENSKQGAFVQNILSEGDSVFWLPTYGDGIIRYEIKSGKYTSYNFEQGWKGTYNIAYNAAWKSKDEIWFTAWGLASFNIRTKKFTFYYDRNELYGQVNTNNILVDYNGTVWETSNQGILKYNETYQPFLFHKLNVKRSDNRSHYGVTNAIYDTARQRTILSTVMAEGLYIFDDKGAETIVKAPLHPQDEPYQILYNTIKTRDNRIIVPSRGYVFELNEKNQLVPIRELNELLPADKVPYFVRFLETRNGDWYVGSYQYGLFQKKKGEKKWRWYHAENGDGLIQNSILQLQEDKEGKIWIGYTTNSVGWFDPRNNTWEKFQHIEKDSSSLISNKFSNLAIHPDGNIWVATLEGVSIYNPQSEKFHLLKLSDGTVPTPVNNLSIDHFGNAWLVTSKNILMVKPDLSYKSFGYDDGLHGALPSYRVAKMGYDWMQLDTQGGYFTFRPSQIMKQPALKSPLVITELKTGDKPLENFRTGAATQLDFDNSHITISFAALNYQTHKNRYLYRMDGIEDQWTETATPNVTYSGLPSGSFKFQLKLVGDNGSSVTLPIVVTTPFYRTGWFRFSLVVIGLTGIFVVYQMRLTQIRNEEKLKSDFKQQLAEAETKALKAQMSPHFIFNSLNSINRYIVKSEPEKASLYLTKFSKLIRQILDNSNLKIISLEQELTALKLYIELETLRFNEKFTYSMGISSELSPMSIGVPPMIIQPFIENAIWHGLLHKETPGHLDIKIERHTGGLKCIITDNGIGRAKAAELKSKSVNKEKSYGMKITRDRLSMLNGNGNVSDVEIIDLMDEAGNATGTKVIVKILSAEIEPEF